MADGYQFSADEPDDGYMLISGDPIPGRTGIETCFIEARRGAAGWEVTDPECVPIPGAISEREAMFERIVQIAGRTVLAAFQTLPYVEQDNLFKEVVGEVNDSTSSSHTGGANFLFADGHVTFSALAERLTTPVSDDDPVVLGTFWNDVAHELRLGALRENWRELPGVGREVLGTEPEGPTLFGYSGLAILTARMVDDPRLERRLLRLLVNAAKAEASGATDAKTRFLTQYIEEVRDGTSNTFLIGEMRTRARVLLLFARAFLLSEVPVPY
jgi:prepilin-type processing-associated H-X9-DG protein